MLALLSLTIKLLFLSKKSLKRTVKAHRWVLSINLSLPDPTQMDNGKPVWLVSMAEQHIIWSRRYANVSTERPNSRWLGGSSR